MARTFNGTTDLIAATVVDIGSSDFTMGAWVKASSAGEGSTGIILNLDTADANTRCRLRIAASTLGLNAFVTMGTTAATTTTANSLVVTGTWQLAICTYTVADLKLRIYLGNLSTPVAECSYTTQTAGAGTFGTGRTNMTIGNNRAANGTWAGDICNAFYTARLWSLDEMEAFRQGARPISTGSLKGFWPLDSPTNTQAEDISGNGANGIVTGCAVADHVPIPMGGVGAMSANASGFAPAIPPNPPDAPTPGTLTAGDGVVTVPYTDGSDGNSVITSRAVNVYDSSGTFLFAFNSSSASPITVSGLSNGVSVKVKMTATNAIGTGSETGSFSNTVTPAGATTNNSSDAYAMWTNRRNTAGSLNDVNETPLTSPLTQSQLNAWASSQRRASGFIHTIGRPSSAGGYSWATSHASIVSAKTWNAQRAFRDSDIMAKMLLTTPPMTRNGVTLYSDNATRKSCAWEDWWDQPKWDGLLAAVDVMLQSFTTWGWLTDIGLDNELYSNSDKNTALSVNVSCPMRPVGTTAAGVRLQVKTRGKQFGAIIAGRVTDCTISTYDTRVTGSWAELVNYNANPNATPNAMASIVIDSFLAGIALNPDIKAVYIASTSFYKPGYSGLVGQQLLNLDVVGAYDIGGTMATMSTRFDTDAERSIGMPRVRFKPFVWYTGETGYFDVNGVYHPQQAEWQLTLDDSVKFTTAARKWGMGGEFMTYSGPNSLIDNNQTTAGERVNYAQYEAGAFSLLTPSIVDVTSPTLTLSTPAAGATGQAAIQTFTGSATDDYGIHYVRWINNSDTSTVTCSTSSGSRILTATTGTFSGNDVGKLVTGTGIPAHTYIGTLVDSTHVKLTHLATATGTNITVTRISSGVASMTWVNLTAGWNARGASTVPPLVSTTVLTWRMDWTATIPLIVGSNAIDFTVYDIHGLSSTASRTVTR